MKTKLYVSLDQAMADKDWSFGKWPAVGQWKKFRY
jgi:hypothetical protein